MYGKYNISRKETGPLSLIHIIVLFYVLTSSVQHDRAHKLTPCGTRFLVFTALARIDVLVGKMSRILPVTASKHLARQKGEPEKQLPGLQCCVGSSQHKRPCEAPNMFNTTALLYCKHRTTTFPAGLCNEAL